MPLNYTNAYSPSNDISGSNPKATQFTRARVGGSSFTVFTWQNKPISFARQIAHQSPQPVGPGTTPIHPLDSAYPVELITPMATTMGAITLELYELYGSTVWQRLAGMDGGGKNAPVDLANLFAAVANSATPIHVFRIVRPPSIRGQRMNPYTEEFHNCVISTVNDGETIEIGTMEVLKQITVNYTHLTRGGKNGLLRDATQLGTTASPPNIPLSTFTTFNT